MYELRLHAKQPGDTAPGNFLWQIVNTVPDGETLSERVVVGGGSDDLLDAARGAAEAFQRIIATPAGPVRHDWDCSCGCQLSMEARRSKTNPYGWDTPREITCNCGRVYGVKLNFAERTAEPRLEPIYRTTVSVPHPS